MKLRALTIGLALSFPLLASAQTDTSVTLYGVIDTGIEFVNKIPDSTGGSHSSVHFTNLTSSWPSYWGLRGTEKINDNLSAIFTLESGFNPGTGTSQQGGRFFGRQAFVGLKGDWGQVAFGRQYNMLMRSLLKADFMGPNDYGLGTIDSYIPNTRMDNAITYMGHFSGVSVGLAYARGRDNVTTGGPAASNCGVEYTAQSACSAYSAMLSYDASNWGVAGAYDVITGSDKTTTTDGVTSLNNFYGLQQGQKDRRFTVNGYFKPTDDFKVSLIYINRKTDADKGIRAGNFGQAGLGNRSDIYTLDASYNVAPQVVIDGSANYIKFNNADTSSNAWYFVARAKYLLSKRTYAYAEVAYIKNKGNSTISASSATAGLYTTPGGNQTSALVGLRHNF
ncbi:MAG: porin [Burkholderiaceae bacterium]|nr:MAG: porin [Burkholderiaceae bacterium]